MLLNINDGIEVTNIDYEISEQEFNTYFLALEQEGYIRLITGASPYKVASYVITNFDKYNKLINNAYRAIPQIIVPIVVTLLELKMTTS